MSINQPPYLGDLARVARIVDGDKDAQDEFYRECVRRTGVLGRRARIPRQDHEDIAHEAFSTALDQMQRGLFRGDGKLTSWLEQIIRGKIAQHWRKQLPQRAESLDETDELLLESDRAETHLAATKRYETREIERIETRIMVEKVLRLMSQRDRAILILNRIERYTPKELSEMGNVPVSRVRNLIYAAQDRFRRVYFEIAPQADMTNHKALLPPDTANEGDDHVKSRSYDSLAGVYCAGDQTQDYGLLLRACRRIGQAFNRIGQAGFGGAFARMRVLLAGGTAIRGGGAGVGHGSQFAADSHAR